ncbi:MAG: hypothetical protein Q8P41_04080 [Pseudomonadota bacterium]|nr:hypothetical protein [Pseudomonadota bacterium]
MSVAVLMAAAPVDPELKRMAQATIDQQSKEIEALRACQSKRTLTQEERTLRRTR